MKKLFFIIFLFSTGVFYAQEKVEVGSAKYDELKKTNQLDGNVLYIRESDFVKKKHKPKPNNKPKSSGCDCYVEPDSTYTLALAPNDDGSSPLINIPFDFCFYGQTYNSFYINNNGNITFGTPLSSFSSTAFPSFSNQIIAPFWADVDTRGGFGQVVYKVTPTAVYINWEDVGYYNIHGDKLNTFQLVITDGADPAIESGNVAFCYKDMQWTTGDASSGVNGFGGIPATAGANKGDNLAYFLIARFDHAGNDFDGALGANDGISWLDDKSFFFDVCNTNNVPPIPDGISACDTFKVCSLGDTADISINFLSPEATQTTTLTVMNGGYTNLQTIANISGNTASIILRIVGDAADVGTYNVSVTATDDFVPAGVTTVTFTVVIDSTGISSINPILDPTESCDPINVGVLNGPYDNYLWDDFSNDPTFYADSTQILGVTVSSNGCYKRVVDTINIYGSPTYGINSDFLVCFGETENIVISDSSEIESLLWFGPGTPTNDSTFSAELGQGNFVLQATTINGCTGDTSFTIGAVPELIISGGTSTCVDSIVLSYTGGNNQVYWDQFGNATPVTFSSNTTSPTTVYFPDFGIYNIIVADTSCTDSDTVAITYSDSPVFDIDSTYYCPGEIGIYVEIEDSLIMQSVIWSASQPGLNNDYSVHLTGTETGTTYNSTLTNIYGCSKDTSFVITTQAPVIINDVNFACGDSIVLENNFSPTSGIWDEIGSNALTFGDINNPNTYVTSNAFGTFDIVYTENVCQDGDTIELSFIPYNDFSFSGETEICFPYATMIEAVILYPQYTTTYLWSTGETGLTIFPDQTGYYTFELNTPCTSKIDSIFVNSTICDFEVPNIFTPNGDTDNDFFQIINTGDYFEKFEITIVNRWGDVMAQFSDHKFKWDGTVKSGKDAEDGTYFYIINARSISGDSFEKQGFVQLQR